MRCTPAGFLWTSSSSSSMRWSVGGAAAAGPAKRGPRSTGAGESESPAPQKPKKKGRVAFSSSDIIKRDKLDDRQRLADYVEKNFKVGDVVMEAEDVRNALGLSHPTFKALANDREFLHYQVRNRKGARIVYWCSDEAYDNLTELHSVEGLRPSEEEED